MTTNPVASVPDLIEHLRAIYGESKSDSLRKRLESKGFIDEVLIVSAVHSAEGVRESVIANLDRLEKLYAESFASVGRNLEAERSNP